MNSNTLMKSVGSALPNFGYSGYPEYFKAVAKRLLLGQLAKLKYNSLSLSYEGELYHFGEVKKNSIRVEVKNDLFFPAMLIGGSVGAAESYIEGHWDSDDLVGVFRVLIQNQKVLDDVDGGLMSSLQDALGRLWHQSRKNSISGSKQNIVAHYDLSNDFYSAWLDPSMSYSAALFSSKKETLESAQLSKVKRMISELDLKPGDHILEIGTGWGFLAAVAVKEFGLKVTTTTISERQYEYAKELFEREAITDKVSLLKEDYRNLKGQYDGIVSVEMIEAVGYRYWPEYIAKVDSLLKPGAKFTMQGITIDEKAFENYKDRVDFIRRFIFPGSCLLSINRFLDNVKDFSSMRLCELKDLGLDYAETLKHWRMNFIDASDEIDQMGFDESFRRLWLYYLQYCEAGFLEQFIGDYQFTFKKVEF